MLCSSPTDLRKSTAGFFSRRVSNSTPDDASKKEDGVLFKWADLVLADSSSAKADDGDGKPPFSDSKQVSDFQKAIKRVRSPLATKKNKLLADTSHNDLVKEYLALQGQLRLL